MTSGTKTKEILRSLWLATPSGPFFESGVVPDSLARQLPTEYLSLIGEFGGKEGFLGTTYLRLYRLEELPALNRAYESSSLYPGCVLFASNGGGTGFGFLENVGRIASVPWIPLSVEYSKPVADNFENLISELAAAGPSKESNPATRGMEVHEITPIVFGGSATDPKNKAIVPPVQHAELARFWNKTFVDLRRRTIGDQR